MTDPKLKLEWYLRDADRKAYGLPPDGLWCASAPCGTFLAGVAEGGRFAAEAWHVKTCSHGCAPVSRVGHTLAWCDVESGMLVRSTPETGFEWHYVRLGEHGACVGCSSERGNSWGFMVGCELPLWDTWGAPGTDGTLPRVTVIAEGIVGTETGAQLRALSEAYDAAHASRTETT